MRVGPGKSTRSSKANEPNAPKRLTCGFENSAWVRAKTVGMMTAALIDRLTARRSGSFLRTHRPSDRPRWRSGALPGHRPRSWRPRQSSGGSRCVDRCGAISLCKLVCRTPPRCRLGRAPRRPVSPCCQSALTGTASWPLSHGRPAAATSSHFDRSTDSPWPRSAGEGPIRSTNGWSRAASKP